MKRLTLLFLFIISPLAVSSQNNELQVKGIKVGTYYSTVIKKLGKPLSFKKNGEYPCDSGVIRTARYNGLIIDFIESDLKKKDFIVATMQVTSSRWSVLGVRIGDNLKTVKTKFGLDKSRREEGFDVFGGYINDGYSSFYFKRGKLIKISWELNPC